MTKGPDRPPLRLRPDPSPALAVFLSATHGAAVAAVWVLQLDLVWRLGLSLLVLASLAWAFCVHVFFLAPWAIRELTWEGDGRWLLTLASGRQFRSELLRPTFVNRWLVVLNFRCGRVRSCSMVLVAGSMDADLLRRLRVRLRLAGDQDHAGVEHPP